MLYIVLSCGMAVLCEQVAVPCCGQHVMCDGCAVITWCESKCCQLWSVQQNGWCALSGILVVVGAVTRCCAGCDATDVGDLTKFEMKGRQLAEEAVCTPLVLRSAHCWVHSVGCRCAQSNTTAVGATLGCKVFWLKHLYCLAGATEESTQQSAASSLVDTTLVSRGKVLTGVV